MVSRRYALTNNKYVEGYNSSKSSSFILYLDANNLYGRAMQEYLPWKNFEWMSPHQLNYDFIKGLEPEGGVVFRQLTGNIYYAYLQMLHYWVSKLD